MLRFALVGLTRSSSGASSIVRASVETRFIGSKLRTVRAGGGHACASAIEPCYARARVLI